jgi:adenine-specific DNA-methyltransferase
LDETKLVTLLDEISERSCLAYVFIVTDADESFREMSRVVAETIGAQNPELKIAQLYRDYVANFAINKPSAKALKVMGRGI